MHAETLRGVTRSKLPFAEYSVARPPERVAKAGQTLFEIVWDEPDFARFARFVAAGRRLARRALAPPVRRREPQAATFAGGHRIRVTPVPIPNTEVKPDTADGTVWETVWESRSLPAVFTKKARCHS